MGLCVSWSVLGWFLSFVRWFRGARPPDMASPGFLLTAVCARRAWLWVSGVPSSLHGASPQAWL